MHTTLESGVWVLGYIYSAFCRLTTKLVIESFVEMVHSKSSRNAVKWIFKRLLIFLTSTTFVLWQGSFLLSRPDDLRRLSINYGGGRCKWQPPNFNVPSDIDWLKTLVVGFPSGDKRLAFMQMEGLTGWPARDEWAYETFGMSNHPFIKSNYPHYDGVWGWEGR